MTTMLDVQTRFKARVQEANRVAADAFLPHGVANAAIIRANAVAYFEDEARQVRQAQLTGKPLTLPPLLIAPKTPKTSPTPQPVFTGLDLPTWAGRPDESARPAPGLGLCPECSSPALHFTEGCRKCAACGWSEC